MRDEQTGGAQLAQELARQWYHLMSWRQTAGQCQGAEDPFWAVVAETASVTGAEFFHALVRALATALGVRYAFVTEVAEAYAKMRTLAFWDGAGFRDGLSDEIASAFCELVPRGEMHHYPAGVQALFPHDINLATLGAESYLAIPLINAGGKVVGHLGVIDEKPMLLAPHTLSRFKIFAARAAAELQRKQMEEALRASEERYRDLYEEAPHAYNSVGVDGRIQRTNRSAVALLGYAQDELIGRSVLDLFPDTPAGKLRAQQIFQRFLAGQETRDAEVEMRRADGGQLWVSLSVRPMRDATGAVVASRSLLVDITARKRAEAALQESERRFQTFMDNSPALAFIKDAAGRYVYLNKPAERRFPTKLATWQGKTDFDLWPAETAKQLRANDLAVLAETRALERIETVPQDDGPHQWLSFKFPLHDSSGRGLVGGMTLDITERKRAEAALSRLQRENLYLQEELKTAYNFEEIIGTSPAIKKVFHAVAQVASTDATVLITGETGTGKELIARALHNRSRRKVKPLIKVNCTALPTGLIESELFGHEKGAFTGAVARKIGRFELADGGTIFLDEIGDIPPEVQLKLLRVLQEQEFERVGGTQTLKINVRVIAATNRDLRRAVEANAFRADLYYRLNVFPLPVPPLRERPEDIALLVHYFVHKYAAKMGKRITEMSQEAMKRVTAYPWPGNIRELEHLIERAVILSRGPILEIPDEFLLPEAGLKDTEERPRTLEEVERECIVKTLEKTRGVIEGPKGAATILKLHPNTLRGRMRRLGITRDHDIR